MPTITELEAKKQELQEKLEKIEPMSKRFTISDNEIYDFSPWPYFLTRAFLFNAGEVFSDIADNRFDNDPSRSKVGNALHSAGWYTLAGLAAFASGVLAIPFAVLETPFGLPAKIVEESRISRQQKYNTRIMKAREEVKSCKKQIEDIDKQIEQAKNATKQDSIEL